MGDIRPMSIKRYFLLKPLECKICHKKPKITVNDIGIWRASCMQTTHTISGVAKSEATAIKRWNKINTNQEEKIQLSKKPVSDRWELLDL